MGVYAQPDDVKDRYEGDFPADRDTWLGLRIDDAEAELFGLVPALADAGLPVTDPARAGRVRRLICDKVLALFRNPDGAISYSNGIGPFVESRRLGSASGSWVSFTDDELARVGHVARTGSAGSVRLRPSHYDT